MNYMYKKFQKKDLYCIKIVLHKTRDGDRNQD